VRPLSLDHLTVIEATPLELIEAAAAGGFDKVGLRIVQPTAAAAVADVIGEPQLQRDLKSLMAATGVSIGLIESIWLSPDTDPTKLEPALATGAELGASFALVCGNDPDEKRTVDNLGRLTRTAKNYGLGIAFEFMPFTQVRTYEDAVRIMRKVAQPNIRLLVDALHVSRSGKDMRTLGKLDSSVVSYVHLCDAPEKLPAPEGLRDEARLGRLYPGDGELPLDDFLDAMPADAALGLEAPCPAYAHLPPVERGRAAGRITRAWLKRHDERRQAAL
jgi:sugar phosphate isomerase/epimerase